MLWKPPLPRRKPPCSGPPPQRCSPLAGRSSHFVPRRRAHHVPPAAKHRGAVASDNAGFGELQKAFARHVGSEVPCVRRPRHRISTYDVERVPELLHSHLSICLSYFNIYSPPECGSTYCATLECGDLRV